MGRMRHTLTCWASRAMGNACLMRSSNYRRKCCEAVRCCMHALATAIMSWFAPVSVSGLRVPTTLALNANLLCPAGPTATPLEALTWMVTSTWCAGTRR